MYPGTDFDQQFLEERVRQFTAQVERRLSGALSEEEFRPLRLMNGLYLQLHAYMLRVAIPYGCLSAVQLRRLADIAERWDRGYGHFTTRQNIQFNWLRLTDVPKVLAALADVGMHAVQTSGNTIRNITTDPFAGVAADECMDPRPLAELLRQWSTDHPEFQFLPRKFKIAISAGETDRAITRFHDIGLRLRSGSRGDPRVELIVGGGLGRTPVIGSTLRDDLRIEELLPYIEATLAVWNRYGRRDNKYKARIKILVQSLGIEAFRAQVEAQYALRRQIAPASPAALASIAEAFRQPVVVERSLAVYEQALASDAEFARWIRRNCTAHREDAYAIVTVSLKAHGETPGDASVQQMRALADLAEQVSQGELRISQSQNVVLPHVHRADLPTLFAALREVGLGTPNAGLLSDIIACPGMDYCSLALARSIPIAQQIATHFQSLGLEELIGPLEIKISGCINACAHHHLGHIGILGLERAGAECYQILLGGEGGQDAAIGSKCGPSFTAGELLAALERLLYRYLALRDGPQERFADCCRRLGTEAFRQALYGRESDTA